MDLRLSDGRGVRVAIVDSGVHAGHLHVRGHPRLGREGNAPVITSGFGVERDPAGATRVVTDFADRHGHGTACAAVVRWGAPAAELVAVRVLDAALATTIDELECALTRLATLRVGVVNLSLGAPSPDARERLRGVTDALLSTGVVLVAALAPDETPTWPSCHAGVLAVSADPTLPPWAYRVERDAGGVSRFYASPFPRPIGIRPSQENFAGTSFAAPRIAALAARALALDGALRCEALVDVLDRNAGTFGREQP